MVQADLVILTSRPIVRAPKCSKSNHSEARDLRRGGAWHEDMRASRRKTKFTIRFL